MLLLHVSNFPCNKGHGAAKFILFDAWFCFPFLFSIDLMEITHGISFLKCSFGDKVTDLMSRTGQFLSRINFAGW